MQKIWILGPILPVFLGALASCPAPNTSATDAGTLEPIEVWTPEISYRTTGGEGIKTRNLLDVRGLIHAHSVYSHDACDGEPVKDGVRDPICFDDFRRGLCQAKHDFVMLTDHQDAFNDVEYPDTLLYRPELGDQLVERGGSPVASWAACPDGSRALILAGSEAGTMFVGLERHLAPVGERGAIYGDISQTSVDALHGGGAVVLQAHPELFSVEELRNMPLDGFEMFNLHANTFLGAGFALDMLLRLNDGDTGLLHPDLFGLSIWSEDARYLQRWGAVLATGAHRVTTMGTDCHRNTFDAIAQDGERVDSYRRMMRMFSNHLLITPNADGTWDDTHLKDALRRGRLYGSFDMMGFPTDFAYFADDGSGNVAEMGDTVSLSNVATGSAGALVVQLPQLQNLDPSREKPSMIVRVLRANDDGFTEVFSKEYTDPQELDGKVRVQIDAPGAYRAEIRMRPLHLREDLRNDAENILDVRDEKTSAIKTLVWIYANPIYVQ